MNINLYLFNYIKILSEYSSSKKLLDSDLESSTRVTRVTRHSPTLNMTSQMQCVYTVANYGNNGNSKNGNGKLGNGKLGNGKKGNGKMGNR